jgi:hypothetical protein
MFKESFLLEFSKFGSLFLINIQEIFVSLIKVFESKNYFTAPFHFTMSCSIRNYYIF